MQPWWRQPEAVKCMSVDLQQNTPDKMFDPNILKTNEIDSLGVEMFFRKKNKWQIIREACKDRWQARTKLNDAERLLAEIRHEVEPVIRADDYAERDNGGRNGVYERARAGSLSSPPARA